MFRSWLLIVLVGACHLLGDVSDAEFVPDPAPSSGGQAGATSAGGSAGAGDGGTPGGTGGTGGTAGSGPLACGENIPAPGDAGCPPPCTMCVGNVCHVECATAMACEGQMIECPAEYECQVTCNAQRACEAAIVNCPDGHACRATCMGDRACRDMSLTCTTGTCDVECHLDSGNQVCNGMDVDCGANACQATCDGSGQQPALTCSSPLCACTPC